MGEPLDCEGIVARGLLADDVIELRAMSSFSASAAKSDPDGMRGVFVNSVPPRFAGAFEDRGRPALREASTSPARDVRPGFAAAIARFEDSLIGDLLGGAVLFGLLFFGFWLGEFLA